MVAGICVRIRMPRAAVQACIRADIRHRDARPVDERRTDQAVSKVRMVGSQRFSPHGHAAENRRQRIFDALLAPRFYFKEDPGRWTLR